MRTPEQNLGNTKPELTDDDERKRSDQLASRVEAARLGGGNEVPENSDGEKQNPRPNIDDIAQTTRNLGV